MSVDYGQRRFVRVETDIAVTIEPVSGDSIMAGMTDVSIGGMSVESSEALDIGTEVLCTFFPDTQRMIEIKGVVSWAKESQFGIRFTGYETVSFVYFKEFILANTHDPHAAEDEILLNMDTLPECY